MNQPFVMRVLNSIQQLQVDGRDILQCGQLAPQVAGQSATLDKGHHQEEHSILFAELDQLQDMRMLQTGNRARLPRETPAHLAVGGITAEYHLDRHAPPERCTLPALVDRPHASYANAPDNIIIAKLRTL